MATTKDFITQYGVLIKGTNAVTSSTGQTNALQVNGGAAIAKNLIVGQDSSIYGSLTVYTDLNVTGNTELEYLLVNQTGTLTNLVVTGTTDVKTLVATTSTFNGPVSITGVNSFTVGTGATDLGGTLSVDGTVTFNNTASATTSPSGSLVVMGGIYADKNLIVNSTNVNSTTNTSNALYVAGGAWINDNLIVNSTDANTSTNKDNALYVAGGAWLDKSLVVNGTAIFKNDVYFVGTATYAFSTNTYVTDNLINIHAPSTGTNWAFDDGRDIGLTFQYYSTTGTTAGLLLANDTKYLEWYDSGQEINGVFTASNYGTFKTGNIILVGTSSATNANSGALQVAGGIGVGDNIYATNNISGGTVTARNLTSGSIVVAGPGGLLTDDPGLTYDILTDIISSVVSTATTAYNLAGGATGSIPYQSTVSQTTFVPIGQVDALLVSNGTTPEWRLVGEIATGYATTATNIRYGSAGQLVYQISTGTTGFVGPGTTGQLLVSGGTSGPTYVNTGNIYVGRSILADTVLTTSTSVDASYYITFVDSNNNPSAAEKLYTDGDISYNPSTNLLTLAGDLAVNGGDITSTQTTFNLFTTTVTTLNFATAGTAIVIGNTTGYTQINNLTTITNTTGATSTTSGALVVSGGAGIGQDLYVGGNLNVSGTITGSLVGNAATVSTVQQTSASAHYLTFVDSNNATATAENIYTTSSFVIVPSTGNVGLGITPDSKLHVAGTAKITGITTVTDTTNASSTVTGALQVAGGAGLGGNLHVGGSVTIGNTADSQVVPAIYSNNVILASYTSPTLTNTNPVNLDSYTAASYRTARYTVQIFDSNKIHITEIMTSHNGTTAYLNEYGILTSDGELGSFDVSLSGGTVTLTFTPSSVTSMVIKVVRFGITA